MKFSEATVHAVSLLNILEESGATASDMMLVSNIFSSLAKARQSSELQNEIQGRMKSTLGPIAEALLSKGVLTRKDVAKVADAVVVERNKRGAMSSTRPINIDDLKVPKGEMN
jgi:hypothetical protein